MADISDTKKGRDEEVSRAPSSDGALPKKYSGLLDSAIVLTLITVSLYIIGYGYYYAFFSRLGVPQRTLELPTATYIKEAGWIVFFASMFVFMSFFETKNPPKAFFTALRGNLFILALIGVLGIWAFRTWEYWEKWIVLVMLLFFFVAVIIYSYQKKSLSYYLLYQAEWQHRVMAICGLLFFCLYIGVYFGDVHATNLIEGKLYNTLQITMQLDNNTSGLDGEPMILVMLHDDLYYLVKQESPAPQYPRIYVVPKAEVKSAVIERIK